MIATHRQMQPLRIWVPTTLDFAYAPPVDALGISVLLVARDDTTLAANAFCHVEVKAVLFAKFQGALRNSRCGVIKGSRAVRCARGGRLTLGRKGEREALFFGPFQ